MDSSIELNKKKKGLNQKESNDILKNIKSKYILQKLFNNLSKKKLLDIIKYNMKILTKLR